MQPLEARDQFPLLRDHVFMNSGGCAPISLRGRTAAEEALKRWTDTPGYFGWIWDIVDDVRAKVGAFLNVPADTIAFGKSTTHGINLIAQGLDWADGDNVVGVHGEHPSNAYPWLALKKRGVEFRMAEMVEGRTLFDDIFALVDDRTRVVTLSHVQSWNGYRIDLETIGSECRRRGIIFSIDAVQSVGAMQLDLGNQPVDFAVAGAQKWMFGGHGIAIVYCSRELLSKVQPTFVGPRIMKEGTGHSVNNYLLHLGSPERRDADYPIDYTHTAQRFEEAPVPLIGLLTLNAAIDILQEVGMDVVEDRVLSLGQRLAEGAVAKGYEIGDPWPRSRAEMSGVITVMKDGLTGVDFRRMLDAAGVTATVNTGPHGRDIIRFSPHFFNTEEEIDHVIDALTPQN